MSQRALSVPTIKINNDVIGIVPNSFKYTSGAGEVKVRAASSGGGNTITVHTQDAETMCSKMSFDIYPTIDNVALIRDWQAAVADNTLQAMQAGSGNQKDFLVAFKGVSVTNDPDIEAGADTKITVEMAGDRLP